MPAVARIGDKFSDEDTIMEGSGNVFTNNIPTARLADKTTGHTLPGHGFYPSAPIIEGSGSVFVNNRPIVREDDAHAVHCDTPHTISDCHDGVVTTASTNVSAG